MRVAYHIDAEAEMIAAARWYDGQRSGLGAEFRKEIERSVASIVSDPERLPVMDGDIRRGQVHRFPYGIYFWVEDDLVSIIAVKHHSRDPDYWKGRR